jgi:hypothetical protein
MESPFLVLFMNKKTRYSPSYYLNSSLNRFSSVTRSYVVNVLENPFFKKADMIGYNLFGSLISSMCTN